jgi:ribosomal protein S18 acetylase RimI-like enzyme
MHFRVSEEHDISAMALIRSREWGGVKYWEDRISGYLYGGLNPQKALASRSCYVAVEEDSVVGFVAGHLTRRYACDGELEWINVIPDQRSKGVASQLLRLMAGWFIEQGARRVCVDVEPSNTAARAFYRRHGAEDLNPHWLVWSDIGCILSEPPQRTV